jgi:hypothetical protein
MRNTYSNLKSENSQDYAQKPQGKKLYVHECLWCGRSHASHIYVSDAATTEEAVKMLSENGGSGPATSAGQFAPSGSVSIWRPRQVSKF